MQYDRILKLSKQNSFFVHTILIFVGANFANIASYILYLLILRFDKELFNTYVPIVSILSIFFVISLMVFRAFVTYGNDLYYYYYQKFKRQKYSSIYVILFLLLPFPLSMITNILVDTYGVLTWVLIFYLVYVSIIFSVYRGILQYENHMFKMILALNIETSTRLFMGFLLGYTFSFGVNGILLSMIIGHILGIIIMLRKVSDTHILSNGKFTGLKVFKNAFVFTLGLEAFINYIVLTVNFSINDEQVLTQFNTLEFFRKTILLSIVTISGLIISTNRTKSHSEKFTYLFSIIFGILTSLLFSVFILVSRDYLGSIVNYDLDLITPKIMILFLLGTSFNVLIYLMSNWLFSFQTKLSIYLPIISFIIQIIPLYIYSDSLEELVTSFTIINLICMIVFLFVGWIYLKTIYPPITSKGLSI